ncbi:hypothetical protein L209DRAFT_460283 [Thermothelomyces heterothallicus CBS 203.75]
MPPRLQFPPSLLSARSRQGSRGPLKAHGPGHRKSSDRRNREDRARHLGAAGPASLVCMYVLWLHATQVPRTFSPAHPLARCNLPILAKLSQTPRVSGSSPSTRRRTVS